MVDNNACDDVLFFPPGEYLKLACDRFQLADDQRTEHSRLQPHLLYIGGLTRVLVLELGDIINILVNDNPWAIALAMRRDVVLAECLRHSERVRERLIRIGRKK